MQNYDQRELFTTGKPKRSLFFFVVLYVYPFVLLVFSFVTFTFFNFYSSVSVQKMSFLYLLKHLRHRPVIHVREQGWMLFTRLSSKMYWMSKSLFPFVCQIVIHAFLSLHCISQIAFDHMIFTNIVQYILSINCFTILTVVQCFSYHSWVILLSYTFLGNRVTQIQYIEASTKPNENNLFFALSKIE